MQTRRIWISCFLAAMFLGGGVAHAKPFTADGMAGMQNPKEHINLMLHNAIPDRFETWISMFQRARAKVTQASEKFKWYGLPLEPKGGSCDFTPAACNMDNPVNPAPVPEPATMLLLGAGLAGLGVFRKKHHK